ncbi:MAG: hypothetical protein ABI442_11015 [Gemmatimonadaceae bacterium]
MRKIVMATAMLAMALPLAAQGGMGKMDMTKKIEGSGKLPEGWMVRFDPPRPNRPAAKIEEVDVRTMGNGIHFTTGPAGIYYNPKDMASGVYAIEATFSAKKSLMHEAYGIFIGGANLQDPTQSYLYFEIRPGMGDSILIQHRNGDDAKKMDKIAAWTSTDGAVHTDDAADGHSTNTLKIHVAPTAVHFYVNGKMVKEVKKSDLMGAATDGQTGIRINHNSDLHVEWKGVSK